MLSTIKDKKRFVVYGGFFLFFFAIFALTPLSVDDTYYKYLGFTTFKELFNFAAGYGNGRVLGNMAGMFFAGHPVACAVVRSAIYTGVFCLIYLLTKTGKEKTDKAILLTELVALFGMNSTLFGRAIAWQSAFFNTIPPLFFALLNLALIKKYGETTEKKWYILPAVCLFSFIGQFFSENSTVYCCALFLMLIIVNGIHFKKPQLPCVLSFVFSVIGAGGMLAFRRFYPLVEREFSSVKAYQGIHIGSVSEIIKSSLRSGQNFSMRMAEFIVLFGILSVEMLVIFSKNNYKSEKLNRLKPLFKFGCVFFSAYGAMRLLHPPMDYPESFFRNVHILILLMAYAFYFVAIVAVCPLIKEKNTRIMFAFSMLFAFGTIAPLLVVSPTVTRALTFLYFFVIIAELLLMREIAEDVSDKKFKNICFSSTCAVAVVATFILTVFVSADFMSKKVDNYCKTQIEQGADEVEVCKLSQSDYYYSSEADSTYRFKFYRNTPGDVKFTEIEMNQWKAKCLEHKAETTEELQ